jgi:hypothetical protein
MLVMHDAHAYAVWCSWCTLVWPGYRLDELVIARAITGEENVRVASRILTTRIPSALLVAVMWLQHTWCPRFRRGTFGYGTTTSPNERDRIWVWKFPCECTLVHPKFPTHMPCNAYSKVTSFLIQKVVSKTKRLSSGMRDRSDLDWQETLGRVCDSIHNLIWSQLAQIMPYEDHSGRRCSIKELHRWGVFGITKQHLGLQGRLAAQRSS